jgi:hypothetical protein
MKKFLLPCCLVCLATTLVNAASPQRDLYVLGFALNQEGEPGGWVQVGPAGAWKETRLGAVLTSRLYGVHLKSRLYTVETDGLWATDLGAGTWKRVGKLEFKATSMLFASGDKLYSIENDGSLYCVDPVNGARTRIGAARAWKDARAGAVIGDKLFTTEFDGELRATDLQTGERTQIGMSVFASTRFLFAADDKLVTIDAGGDLHCVTVSDGSRTRLRPAGAWRSVLGGAVMNGRLYTAEKNGTLHETNLATGQRTQIGGPDFGNTKFMFAAGADLYTIESDGNLYRVIVKPSATIDSYNWCPEEIEKVFREQGKAFYHDFHVRQVLGKHATHAGALDGLAWLRNSVTKDDFVVMYVGCHGFTDPNEGWGVTTADRKTLWGREIKAELAKLPCQVLILIETCTSGGFTQSHPHDPAVPPNVTAICACSGQQSTDNQLDLAVAEALYGRADFNHDGVIDLDELIRYTEQRYREWWPQPKKDDGHETPAIVHAKALPASLPLTKPSPALCAIVHKGELWSSLLEKQGGDKFQVHLLGWSSKPGPYFRTNSVTRDCICLPNEGPPLLVLQNGVWYPARILGKEGAKFKVHYLGWKEDEVVTAARIKYPFAGRPQSDAGGAPSRPPSK